MKILVHADSNDDDGWDDDSDGNDDDSDVHWGRVDNELP